MFRESISVKSGHVGYLLHAAPQGNLVVATKSKVNVHCFITVTLVQSWEASLTPVIGKGNGALLLT